MARTKPPYWEQFDLPYFHRLAPFRRWKRWLSIGCALGGVAWVVLAAVDDDPTLYSSGPMSNVHTQLADKCNLCHTQPWDGLNSSLFREQASVSMNRACLNCHRTTIGHDAHALSAWHQPDAQPLGEPEPFLACDRCHVEHQGIGLLATIEDNDCTSCHANLENTESELNFHAHITSFVTDHPEFQILKDSEPDQTRIKFNHAQHLKPDLRTPTMGSVQMKCDDCHRTGKSLRPWPYGQPGVHEAVEAGASKFGPELADAHMQPIRFSLHCQSCHALTFDPSDGKLTGRGSIPHDRPEMVRTFLHGQLAQYIRVHPEELSPLESDTSSLRPSRRPVAPKEIDRLSLEWIDQQLSVYERMIYQDKKVCLHCHEQAWSTERSAVPTIVPPQIPSRWFQSALFNHAKHRVWDCSLCHEHAEKSTTAQDVLLPGIEGCRACHAPQGGNASSHSAGVDHHCALCHTYHLSPTGADSPRGSTLYDLLGGRSDKFQPKQVKP